MEYPQRKLLRLRNYDYSQNGTYFTTICTHERQSLLSQIVGVGLKRLAERDQADQHVILTTTGIEIEKSIKYIDENKDNIMIDKYVIMPNHLHMIIIIESNTNENLSSIIQKLKSYTTNKYHELTGTTKEHLWQRGYYDHIIRNEEDYLRIWQYIETNPAKWAEDEYYM